VDGLYLWLRGVEVSGMKDLQAFARIVWLDRGAGEAALRLEWSNGHAEGKVNKLKLLRRMVYGRSTFDLLHRHALHAA